MLVIKYSLKAFNVCFLEKEIAMARPVVVSVSQAVENGSSQVVTISFFISAAIVLPELHDQTIKYKVLPAAKVFVR